MAADEENYALVCQKIDTVNRDVKDLKTVIKDYTTVSELRLRQVEIQTSLLEQSNKAICKEVDDQDGEIEKIATKVDKSEYLSKLFGAITGFFTFVALVVAILSTILKGS